MFNFGQALFPLESLGRQTYNHPTIQKVSVLTQHGPEHYDEHICDREKEKWNSVTLRREATLKTDREEELPDASSLHCHLRPW